MLEGISVLDVGCGDGAILQYLVEHKAVDAHGVDISERAVAHCRAQGLDVWLADVTQPEALGALAEYDYIILSEIIEHVSTPEDLLNGLHAHVRQAFIISVPNTGYIWHRPRLLLGCFPLQCGLLTPASIFVSGLTLTSCGGQTGRAIACRLRPPTRARQS